MTEGCYTEIFQITNAANCDPIGVKFGADSDRTVACDFRSTRATRYARAHLDTAHNDTANQTRTYSLVSVRHAEVDSMSLLGCVFAQA